jgi:hypothetical protein
MGLAMRVEAHAVAALVRLLLRLLPLPRVVSLVAQLPHTRCVSAPRDCASAAASAARRIAHPTCLFTALTTFALLARRGYSPRIVIGVARGHSVDAHAWVTLAGMPVVPCARDYAALWSYGTSPAETS